MKPRIRKAINEKHPSKHKRRSISIRIAPRKRVERRMLATRSNSKKSPSVPFDVKQEVWAAKVHSVKNRYAPVSDNVDAILNTWLDELGRLAMEWRTTKQDATVKQYQEILRRVIATGYTDPLDVDSELPDRLMPEEYLALHR